jgi:thioredoxin-related protein
MKKIVLIGMIGLSLLGETLNIAKNYDEAIKTDKIVMVMLTQVGCDMCDFVKDRTFKDKKFIEVFNERFVAVEMDIHRDKPQWKALGTPTFYFVKKGKNIKRLIGGAKADSFIEELDKIR